MITSSEEIMKMLSINLQMKIEDDKEFEKIILMSPLDAYEFSLITGADYMIVPIGYSVKGRMEVSIHRSVFQNGGFIYTPGIYSRTINGVLVQGESIKTQFAKYPELFSGMKKLIIVDVKDSSCIEKQIYERIINSKLNPADYLLYKSFNNGSNNEPLYEYLASKFFQKKGMLTENQAPWFNQNYRHDGKKINGGIPDFSAFQNDDLHTISEEFCIDFTNIQMLSGLFLTDGKPKKSINSGYRLIIGEAKVSKSGKKAAYSQLSKYADTDLPNELYYLIPDLQKEDVEEFGVMNLDSGLRWSITKTSVNQTVDLKSQSIDSEWISNIAKMYLLSNLDFNFIVAYIRKKLKLSLLSKISSECLVKSVCESSMREIIDYVRDNITYLGVW